MLKSCPTPHKVKHGTETQAVAHARALRRDKPGLPERAYKCQCGKWHVGWKLRVKSPPRSKTSGRRRRR